MIWGGEGTTGECAIVTSGGCTSNANQINFWSMSGGTTYDLSRMIKNVVHELGHAFNDSLAYTNDDGLTVKPSEDMPNNVYNRNILRPNQYTDRLDWQQSRRGYRSEVMGDIFIAWVYDVWSTDPRYTKDTNEANAWMGNLVP